jgi:hypothetical protein
MIRAVTYQQLNRYSASHRSDVPKMDAGFIQDTTIVLVDDAGMRIFD